MGELSQWEGDSEEDKEYDDRSKFIGQLVSVKDAIAHAQKGDSLFYRELCKPIQEIEKSMRAIEDHQLDKMTQHKDQLLSEFPESDEGKEDCEYFRNCLDRYIKEGDIVAASELLVQARDAVRNNKQLVKFSEPGCGAVCEFRKRETDLTESLIRDKRFVEKLVSEIKKGKTLLKLPYQSLVKRDKEKAINCLESINNIRREEAQASSSFQESLKKKITIILDSLGIVVSTSKKLNVIKQVDGDYYFIAVPLELRVECPIPFFGSELDNELRVLILKKNVSPKDIKRLIKELVQNNKQILVIQTAPMRSGFRYEFKKVCVASERSLQLLFLDLSMIVFILSHKDRLELLFDLTMPFTWSQPYMMKGENVAPEMFVGRDKEISGILDQSGPCIVYGGRQLGKSALLRHVVNEYNSPNNNIFINYLDIDDLGTGIDSGTTSYSDVVYEFWDRVNKSLIRTGFCEKTSTSFSSRQYKKIESHVIEIILKKLDSNKNASLLLLLDEADDLINADFTVEFGLIKRLRSLMVETNRRFKVVFAGLHSVQRYKKLSNHPFAQLGEEIVINPLSAEAAQKLVTLPLKALGFEFESSSLVLGIFAPVNYHPGLLQIFCFRLLEKLYDRVMRSGTDGYTVLITKEDVRSIERNRELRNDIRNRFDWTLDLDDRYKLLTYALVLSSSATEQLSVGEFLQLGVEWWPAEFASLDLQSTRALLDEMEGLGVLVTVDSGDHTKYQLRSPNLLRLLGNKDEIEKELERIILQDARKESNPRNYHTVIDKKPLHFGCFALDQSSELFSDRDAFSIKIIHGSKSLGSGFIEKSLASISSSAIDKDNQSWTNKIIPPQHLSSEERLINYLSKELKPTNRKNYYYIIEAQIFSNDIDLTQLIKNVDAEIAKSCRTTSKARIFFNFDPELTWNWIINGCQGHLEGMSRVAEMNLRPWSDGAIWKGLEKSGVHTRAKQESPEIFNITAGFHYLIDGILSHSSKTKDITSASDVLEYTRQHVDGVGVDVLKDKSGLNVLPAEIYDALASTLELIDIDEVSNGYILGESFFQLVFESVEGERSEWFDAENLFGSHDRFIDVLIRWLLTIGVILPRPKYKGKYLMLPIVRNLFK